MPLKAVGVPGWFKVVRTRWDNYNHKERVERYFHLSGYITKQIGIELNKYRSNERHKLYKALIRNLKLDHLQERQFNSGRYNFTLNDITIIESILNVSIFPLPGEDEET